jgi:hypothetical protein
MTLAILCAALGPLATEEVTDRREIFTHAIRPDPVVLTPWEDISKGYDNETWEFELTVDEEGRVIDAKLEDGPDKLRARATAAAKAVRFRPFQRDGRAVRVRLWYPIQSKALDYAGPIHRVFPANPPPASIVIALSRSACYGSCPVYRVELSGTGEVTYQGDAHVAVKGTHHWRIDPKKITPLLDLFRRADFFNLKGYYEMPVTDLPTFVTTLQVGHQRKFVLDYGNSMSRALASASFGGEDPRMPAIVTQIENAIDEVAGTASRVKGND